MIDWFTTPHFSDSCIDLLIAPPPPPPQYISLMLRLRSWVPYIISPQSNRGQGGEGGEAFLKRKCHCFEHDSVTAEHLARRWWVISWVCRQELNDWLIVWWDVVLDMSSETVVINSWVRTFKLLWSPGIDSKKWIKPAYETWRAGTITLFLLGS